MAKMGRPSSYREEYCDKIIEFLAGGHSIEAFAGLIGVHPTTVFDWKKQYPEFAEAAKIASAKAVLYWELQLKETARTGKGHGTLIIFALQNRARDSWRDIRKVELSGVDGGPIETKDTTARDRLFDLVSRVSEREREDENNKKRTH